MKNYIRFVRIPLQVCGFDVFVESENYRDILLRLLSFLTIIIFIVCLCVGITVDKNMETTDQIIVFVGIKAMAIIFYQMSRFWHRREKILKIFNEIETLYDARDEIFIQDISKKEFEKTSKFLEKFCR